jgi:DNA-binding response OmpR family regulator
MCRQIALHIDRSHQRQAHIRRHLEMLGFELHRAATVPEAMELTKKYCYRLILMYFNVVGKEIFGFCSFVRMGGTNTVLITLMNKPQISIEGRLFDYGVNDVVAGEQTAATVLIKRIRMHLYYSKTSPAGNNTIRLKDTLINLERREVWCNGTIRHLGGMSADLLKYFLDNPSRTISREELCKSPLWADSICSTAEEGGKTFDVNVGKLRKVIESNPANPQIIKPVRGIGWILAINPGG